MLHKIALLALAASSACATRPHRRETYAYPVPFSSSVPVPVSSPVQISQYPTLTPYPIYNTTARHGPNRTSYTASISPIHQSKSHSKPYPNPYPTITSYPVPSVYTSGGQTYTSTCWETVTCTEIECQQPTSTTPAPYPTVWSYTTEYTTICPMSSVYTSGYSTYTSSWESVSTATSTVYSTVTCAEEECQPTQPPPPYTVPTSAPEPTTYPVWTSNEYTYTSSSVSTIISLTTITPGPYPTPAPPPTTYNAPIPPPSVSLPSTAESIATNPTPTPSLYEPNKPAPYAPYNGGAAHTPAAAVFAGALAIFALF